VLLAFYNFPAEQWIHLRTTNPIESTFATVRLRQRVTKGPGSRAAGVAMAFNLIESAQARGRAVNVPHLVALVRAGGTVLLSSHLLGEVQATVDRLVVIASGRVAAQGTLDDLLTSTGVVVRSTDMPALRTILDRVGAAHHLQDDGAVLVEHDGTLDAERIARLAAQSGVLLVELRESDRAGLEQLFFSLTGGAESPQTLEAVR
jgi:hypothetical protein